MPLRESEVVGDWTSDNALKDWLPTIWARHIHFEHTLTHICASEGSLHEFCFTNGLHSLGLHREAHSFRYREWAPTALAMSLVGDFNEWDVTRHPCKRSSGGVFEVYVHDFKDGSPAVQPGMRYKASVRLCGPSFAEVVESRVPAWAHCTKQDPLTGEMFAIVQDPLKFLWRHPRPMRSPAGLRVYEVHVGIASSSPVVAGWTHFRRNVLPRVVSLGYTALLLMAVQEHGYYASFGYQVTSFFAPSSRFGSPTELQELIDAAHGAGLLVFFELVHSHASSNSREGLDAHYFLEGPQGWHAEWGTRLFDFARLEVLRFLLSQVCWFVQAFHVDGFRFDAVSAALYRHRSLGGHGRFDQGLTNFFGEHCEMDVAALSYFKLVNLLSHYLMQPALVTIAEEHSGLPGLCAPVLQRGVGFDYRQAMGLAPLWDRLLSNSRQSTPFDLGRIVHELCQRRNEERRLAYCECHDGSLVGGQTLAFRLMGRAMYAGMSVLEEPAKVIEHGMALHKLVRLLTSALGGEAYLNFMGNEFGHPEWIDFPRSANMYSLLMARRRWDLADDPLLRYSQLSAFDAAMHAVQNEHPWLDKPAPRQADCGLCEVQQLLWFVRGGKLFAFNFHPVATATVQIWSPLRDVANPCDGAHLIPLLLSSDGVRFGGYGRCTDASVVVMASPRTHHVTAAPAPGNAEQQWPLSSTLRVRVPPKSGSVLLLSRPKGPCG